MSKYQEAKDRIYNEAIDFVLSFDEGEAWSWGGLYEAQQYFEKMGKRYGLLEEFRDNGII